MFYLNISAIILVIIVAWINFHLEKNKRKVLKWVLLILIIVPCLINGGVAYKNEKKSIQQFSDLYISKADSEITKMRLNNASSDLEIIEKYEYISKLNSRGSEQMFFMAINPDEPLIPEGLPAILFGSYNMIDQGRGTEYKCDPASQEKFIKAIDFNPDYPFSYYALAVCKMDEGGNEWIEYGEKALEILQITTQIGGHNSEHDTALENLIEYLPN